MWSWLHRSSSLFPNLSKNRWNAFFFLGAGAVAATYPRQGLGSGLVLPDTVPEAATGESQMYLARESFLGARPGTAVGAKSAEITRDNSGRSSSWLPRHRASLTSALECAARRRG